MKIYFVLPCLLLAISFPLLAQETFTITTYYPAPFGVYQRLVTNTLGVGDTNGSGGIDAADAPDPAVADQAGDVWIAGDVAVGTSRPEKIGGFPVTVDINGYLTLTNPNSNVIPGVMYTANASDAANFDDELVITMGRDADHNGILRPEGGDDRSKIWIGTEPDDGGVGQIELNARTVFINRANVGIGTDRPTEKLEIAGTAGTDGIKYPDGTKQTSARLSCMSTQSTWGPITNGSTISTSCPANYVGVTCEFVFYDRNSVVNNAGNAIGTMQYTGSQKSSWNANRTTCSQTINDGGISQGAVYVDCCRIP